LQDDLTNEYLFYLKGADSVMANIVGPPDWLDEEVRELARTGLRTLVVAKKVITKEQYELFKVTD
jgi:phospholipid-translocating ATPase